MAQTFWKNKEYITTWQQFDRMIRSKGCRLLKRLNEFSNSILVTGCQRSGTTALSRLLTQSEGITNYWFGPDDELDAALILSGYVDHHPQGRYCFQTTYVGHPNEYFDQLNNFKVLWSLRNPHSVIQSMLYNWSEFALNYVFTDCGIPFLRGKDKLIYKMFGLRAIPKLLRACCAYNGKTSQVFDLKQHLNENSMIVIDYDELVRSKEVFLQAIYQFFDMQYHPKYADWIHAKSVGNKSRLSSFEVKTITEVCTPVYLRSRDLLSKSIENAG